MHETHRHSQNLPSPAAERAHLQQGSPAAAATGSATPGPDPLAKYTVPAHSDSSSTTVHNAVNIIQETRIKAYPPMYTFSQSLIDEASRQYLP